MGTPNRRLNYRKRSGRSDLLVVRGSLFPARGVVVTHCHVDRRGVGGNLKKTPTAAQPLSFFTRGCNFWLACGGGVLSPEGSFFPTRGVSMGKNVQNCGL